MMSEELKTAHFAKMQDMARRYLEPAPYVDRVGHVCRNGSDAELHAFLGDVIYMLDGPEQRVAFPNAALATPTAQPVEARDEWVMVNRLRDEEADTVTILCDNPEGPPNNAVECSGFWTGFADRRFEGATIAEALAVAVAAKDEAAHIGYPPIIYDDKVIAKAMNASAQPVEGIEQARECDVERVAEAMRAWATDGADIQSKYYAIDRGKRVQSFDDRDEAHLFARRLNALAAIAAMQPTIDAAISGERANAYIAGATDVHNHWAAGNVEPDPDFGEAASDYAAQFTIRTPPIDHGPGESSGGAEGDVGTTVQRVKDILRGPDGEEYTDSGMENAFFRWPTIARAIAAALSGASEVVESQKEDVRSIPNQICSHDWQESVSSQFSNEYRVEVYCPKCCTYGEKEYETGEITWPCT
ncbi:hypothetical protein D3Y57_19015 [Sphingomonas paeninsulae]|uniref:Uncharacterized protein n=1 Tax=Sphingomonas paeninsulae TaxID=2319844 RepID=A0A494TQ82_SPHPE|nr:hypothetical protein [Sphingomonas paeninsulae]AYJ87628.1 hypothetical protein D3Y57_19015 [Sphingomonas paeninsulae]